MRSEVSYLFWGLSCCFLVQRLEECFIILDEGDNRSCKKRKKAGSWCNIHFCHLETWLKYVVHDVTYTEYRVEKMATHIGLSWGDFQTQSVITFCLSFMFGVCLLWSSNTQDHTLRKTSRVSHGKTISVSPFGVCIDRHTYLYKI